jgi:hypothetical protein
VKVKIEKHTPIDKNFDIILEDLDFKIGMDYDDVDHVETDAVAQYIGMLIEMHWEDEVFHNIFQTFLIRKWNADKYLREDYENDMEAYLKSRLPEPRPDFKDVVINTEDRFIGWYLGYRVSAVRLEGKDMFEYDIKGKNGMAVVEVIQSFDDMNALLFDVKHRIRCL